MYILELFLNTMHYDIPEHLSLLLQNMMNFVQIQLLFKGKISGRGSSLQNFFEICNFVVEKGRGSSTSRANPSLFLHPSLLLQTGAQAMLLL